VTSGKQIDRGRGGDGRPPRGSDHRANSGSTRLLLFARRPTIHRIAAVVLAAVDPLAPDPAPVRFAAAVAGRTGAPLNVVSICGDSAGVTPLAAGQSGEDLADNADADAALEQAVRVARDEGVGAEPLSAVATSAPRGLALLAVTLGAGLVVVGSGAGGPPGQLRLGSTAERLLHGAPSAVALVPDGWEAHGFATIGAGFVDSAEGRAAVREAHALAARSGARLRVLTALRPRHWSRATADELRALGEAAAAAAVSGLLGAPVDVDVSLVEPADLLVAVSGELDVLVCGTRGYGPRPAALLGGVTRRVFAEARCPVVVLSGAPQTGLAALVR
jgi:nucleotide-binding universal stress UspA family protein